MNKIFVFTVLAGFSTSCSTIKNSSDSNTVPTQQPVATSTPVFLENVAIRSENKSSVREVKEEKNQVGLVENGGAKKSTELTFPLQFKYSILLDVPVEEIYDTKLFNYIEEWYGTRYRYGGNDKTGIDCSAFTQTFLSNFYNLSIPRTSVDQYINSKRVKKELLQPGDLVFFRTTNKKSISHVGVYLFNNKFLHSSTSYGVIISDLKEGYYSNRFAGGGRVKKAFD